MSVRTELGIPFNAPWFAIACESPSCLASTDSESCSLDGRKAVSATSALPWLRDLAWRVPEAHFGALAMHCQHSSSLEYPVGWGTLSASIPTSMAQAGADTLLDWLCAADGWLVWGESALDNAILDVANTLALPAWRMDQSPIDDESLALAMSPDARSNSRWYNAHETIERLQSSLAEALGNGKERVTSSRWHEARRAA